MQWQSEHYLALILKKVRVQTCSLLVVCSRYMQLKTWMMFSLTSGERAWIGTILPTLMLIMSPPPTAVWTWLQSPGWGERGRSCPVSTRSCSATCRTSSTPPGTWPSTGTCWTIRTCSRQSSPCSPSSRRTSPSCTKVGHIICLYRSLTLTYSICNW